MGESDIKGDALEERLEKTSWTLAPRKQSISTSVKVACCK